MPQYAPGLERPDKILDQILQADDWSKLDACPYIIDSNPKISHGLNFKLALMLTVRWDRFQKVHKMSSEGAMAAAITVGSNCSGLYHDFSFDFSLFFLTCT